MSELESLLKHCNQLQYYRRLMDANLSTFEKLQEKRHVLDTMVKDKDHLRVILDTLGTRGQKNTLPPHSSRKVGKNSSTGRSEEKRGSDVGMMGGVPAKNQTQTAHNRLQPSFSTIAAAEKVAGGGGSSSNHFADAHSAMKVRGKSREAEVRESLLLSSGGGPTGTAAPNSVSSSGYVPPRRPNTATAARPPNSARGVEKNSPPPADTNTPTSPTRLKHSATASAGRNNNNNRNKSPKATASHPNGGIGTHYNGKHFDDEVLVDDYTYKNHNFGNYKNTGNFVEEDDDNEENEGDENDVFFSTSRFRFDENYDHNTYLFDQNNISGHQGGGEVIDLLYDELDSWHRQLMAKLRIMSVSRAEALTQRSNVFERGIGGLGSANVSESATTSSAAESARRRRRKTLSTTTAKTIRKGEFQRLQARYDHLKTLLAMTRNAMKQHRRNIELLRLCRRQTNRGADPAELDANEIEVKKGQEMVKNILVVLQEDGPTLMDIDVVHFAANGERYFDEADDEALASAGYTPYSEIHNNNNSPIPPNSHSGGKALFSATSTGGGGGGSGISSGSRVQKYKGPNGERLDSLGKPSTKKQKSGRAVRDEEAANDYLNEDEEDMKNGGGAGDNGIEGFCCSHCGRRGDGDNLSPSDPFVSDPYTSATGEWINLGNVRRPIYLKSEDIDAVFRDEPLLFEEDKEKENKKNGTSDDDDSFRDSDSDTAGDEDEDEDDEQRGSKEGSDPDDEQDADEKAENNLTRKRNKAVNKKSKVKTSTTSNNGKKKDALLKLERVHKTDKKRIRGLLRRIKSLEEEQWTQNENHQKESLAFFELKEKMEREADNLKAELKRANKKIEDLLKKEKTQSEDRKGQFQQSNATKDRVSGQEEAKEKSKQNNLVEDDNNNNNTIEYGNQIERRKRVPSSRNALSDEPAMNTENSSQGEATSQKEVLYDRPSLPSTAFPAMGNAVQISRSLPSHLDPTNNAKNNESEAGQEGGGDKRMEEEAFVCPLPPPTRQAPSAPPHPSFSFYGNGQNDPSDVQTSTPDTEIYNSAASERKRNKLRGPPMHYGPF